MAVDAAVVVAAAAVVPKASNSRSRDVLRRRGSRRRWPHLPRGCLYPVAPSVDGKGRRPWSKPGGIAPSSAPSPIAETCEENQARGQF